ncbi:flagellar hook-length control protein FliK [Pleomorphomonas sp. NRK KF1]|uniref:flagellar hook-length control protein FliK n=1 Tax=Pleomorphomonas sp. NRK KF1 TaxID=2943000 RepID=UPI002044A238|nr:flagellar hook-length control protein FliK [Pleomorphomonas sp. NRK KF1]MCM5552071.1 flagellar hook-length control protein FliK [Pleomorphomonas sp. NRK KF1]
MTRIDTPLTQPAPEKSADKTTGKTSPKDDDGRQAAFRSLLRQLGGHSSTKKGDAGKDAKDVPGEVTRKHSPTCHRAASREDKVAEPSPDALSTATPAEPMAAGDQAVDWQAILGRGEQQGQPPLALDLAPWVAPRPLTDDSAQPQQKTPTMADRQSRLSSVTLPSDTDIDLARTDATGSAATEQADPFTALSSLLDGEIDTAAEPEGVDIAPLKMSVIARETHFEPVTRLSPVQQIATAVGDDLAALSDPAEGEVATRPAEPARHSSGPLKVLHLKLEPEDLGAVVLKMRLVDKSLELEVVASRQETADLLAKDRDMLTRALRSSGYAADIVTITTSTSPDSGQMTGDNRSGGQASSGQAGSQAGGNRDSNNAAGGGDRPSARPQPMEATGHEESGTGRSGGDLYL